jgi:histone deacetylase complex regulatory component SIN3
LSAFLFLLLFSSSLPQDPTQRPSIAEVLADPALVDARVQGVENRVQGVEGEQHTQAAHIAALQRTVREQQVRIANLEEEKTRQRRVSREQQSENAQLKEINTQQQRVNREQQKVSEEMRRERDEMVKASEDQRKRMDEIEMKYASLEKRCLTWLWFVHVCVCLSLYVCCIWIEF